MSKKNLKGSDIILNLKEISIIGLNSFSSCSCSGPVSFVIDCDTKHGYCEDPRFTGEIKILSAKKLTKDTYTLKIKFIREKEDYE